MLNCLGLTLTVIKKCFFFVWHFWWSIIYVIDVVTSEYIMKPAGVVAEYWSGKYSFIHN